MKKLLTFLFVALIASPLIAKPQLGKMAPEFTLKDSNGKEHTLSDYRGQFVVLEWINFDCPFVKKHYKGGDMQALQAKYTSQKGIWLSICSSAPGKQGHFQGAELAARIEKEKFAGTAYLLDSSGNVGRLYGAKTTPHIFILDKQGKLIYQGAIDDNGSPWGKPSEANNYVRQILNPAMTARSFEPLETKPYGCSVKY